MYYKISEVSQLMGVHTQTKMGSKNRMRSRKRIAKLHWSIANSRSDFLHKITTELARKQKIVAVEDLNVKGMMKNRKLSLSIADVGWGEFFRQLKYKCEWYGSTLVVAQRFFPSSKLCSNCGYSKKDLSLADRIYCCGTVGWRLIGMSMHP